MHTCSVCGKETREGEYLVHDRAAICGSCKNSYFQRLRELGPTRTEKLPQLRRRVVVLCLNWIWGMALYGLTNFLLVKFFPGWMRRYDFVTTVTAGLPFIALPLIVSGRWLRLQWTLWSRAFAGPALALSGASVMITSVTITLVIVTGSFENPKAKGPLDTLTMVQMFIVIYLLETSVFLGLLWLCNAGMRKMRKPSLG